MRKTTRWREASGSGSSIVSCKLQIRDWSHEVMLQAANNSLAQTGGKVRRKNRLRRSSFVVILIGPIPNQTEELDGMKADADCWNTKFGHRPAFDVHETHRGQMSMRHCHVCYGRCSVVSRPLPRRARPGLRYGQPRRDKRMELIMEIFFPIFKIERCEKFSCTCFLQRCQDIPDGCQICIYEWNFRRRSLH